MVARTLEVTFVGNPKPLQGAFDSVGNAAKDASPKIDKAAKSAEDVGDKAEKSRGHLGGLGGALADVGKIAGGIIIAKAFEEGVGAIRGAFSAAADYQKMQAATNAVIESTGGKAGMSAKAVVDLANSLEAVTAIDDQVIQGGENLLLTFTNIGKDVFPAATEAMLNMSTALGQDVSASAVQLGKALNDPIKGVTALSKVGVSFTQSQKDAIKAMVEMGDTAGAQKLILAELNTEFGGAAKAAGSTLAGQLSLLQDTISDTFRDIAVKALPTLLSLTQMLAKALPEAIDLAGQGIGALVDFLTPVFAFAWDKLSGPLTTIAGLVWDALKDGASALGNLAGLAWDGVTGLVDALTPFAAMAWGAIKDGLDALGNLAGLAWDGVKDGMAALGGLANIAWDKVKDGAKALADIAVAKFDQLSPQLTDLGTAIKGIGMETFANAWEHVKTALQPAYDVLKPLVEQVLNALKDQVRDVGNALKPLGEAFADLGRALQPLEPLLKPLGVVLGVVIVGAIAALLLSLQGLIKFMTFTFVVAIDAVVIAIKSITIAIDFVTKAVTEWGPQIVSAGAAVIQWFKDLPGKITGFVAGFPSLLTEKGKALISGLLNAITAASVDLFTWFGNLPGLVVQAFGDVTSTLWSVGQDLVNGLWNGISSAWDGLVSKLEGLVGKLPEPVKKILHIGSPSKVFAAEIGVPIVTGIMAGVDSQAPALYTQMAQIVQQVRAIAASAVGAAGGMLNNTGNVANPGSGGAFGGNIPKAVANGAGNIPGIAGYDTVWTPGKGWEYVPHDYGGSAPGVPIKNGDGFLPGDSQANHPGQYWDGSAWRSINVNNATSNPTFEQANTQPGGMHIDVNTGRLVPNDAGGVTVNIQGDVYARDPAEAQSATGDIAFGVAARVRALGLG